MASAAPAPADDLLALDEALARFEAVDPSAARLVKLRFFAGLSMPEAAEALDEALGRLESADPLAARLVKLRFFAGLSMPQAAEVLGVPLRTAQRNWTYARTWLHRALEATSS